MRHARPEAPSTRPSLRRRAGVVGLAAGLVLAAAVGTASAKEVGSGGTPTPTTTTCNPVSGLGYKGDATTSDTALATVQVSYKVKSCDGSAVTADLLVFQTAAPDNVALDAVGIPLSGKLTAVVRANTSYIARFTVRDAATGAVVGTNQIFVAAVYKGV
ncbi:MAG: hypothetical protein AB7O74_13915 [Candidatus Nanopelagicales bacterium]